MLSRHRPGPSPGPPRSPGTESLSSCRRWRGPEGTSVFRQSLSGTRPSCHRPGCRPWGEPGAGRLAGSPRPSSEAGPPSLAAGQNWASWGHPASPPSWSPGAYTDLGLYQAGERGPGPKASEENRGQGPCPAPSFPWKPAADRPERCSVGYFPASPRDAHHTPFSCQPGCQVGALATCTGVCSPSPSRPSPQLCSSQWKG